MNRYVMRRRDDCDVNEDLQAGEYRQFRRSGTAASMPWAICRCPTCGLLMSITRSVHRVDHEGNVNPVGTCPHAKCEFSRWIRLDGWVPEGVGSA